MTSAPSFKEVSKAINAFVPKATLPLPDDLVEIIEGYLEKHEKHDKSVAERLHDELVSIWHRSVVQKPERYAAFLAILRCLRPILGQPERILQWWELLSEPVLDSLNQEKHLVPESQAVVLETLTAESKDEPEDSTAVIQPLASRILKIWLEEGSIARAGGEALGSFKEKQIRETLTLFGKKRPKDFMAVLDGFFVKKDYRMRILSLLGEFVQSQPPHLHQVIETPLFNNLLNCLQYDTSTTTVSLALNALIMLLPHIPSDLVPHLPTLFNIYARLLFWDRELTVLLSESSEGNQEHHVPTGAGNWENREFGPGDGTSIPHLIHYFTILYGLYPINFMDYIRKPRRYLWHAKGTDTVEFQQNTVMHDASERFRQCHLLHPNFYTLTISDEKEELGRFLDCEPSQLVAECMALCLQPDGRINQELIAAGASTVSLQLIREDTERDSQDPALLSSSYMTSTSPFGGLSPEHWRNSHLSAAGSSVDSRLQSVALRHGSQSSRQSQREILDVRATDEGGNSPTLGAYLVASGSQTHLQEMINSNKAIKSELGSQSLANDSVASLPLSHQESIPERPPSNVAMTLPSTGTAASSMDKDTQIATLYRQILLLHNDLNFERYMKLQHLSHIGELRRRHMKDAASDAEVQNLVNANRNLKHRLEEAKKTELQVKQESEKTRTLAKKWEADLSTKLRNLREQKKKWGVEGDTLRRELEAFKAENYTLTKLVCEVEVRELAMKQKVQSVESDVDELRRLQKEVERLTVSERDFEAKETARQTAISEATEAQNRAESLKMQLSARDAEVQKTRELFESQITELNARLKEALEAKTGRTIEGVQQMLENASAASQAKQAELQKQYSVLMRKYTVAQQQLLDAQLANPRRSTSGFMLQPMDGELDGMSSSPASSRNNRLRGFSDPEPFEPTSYNATPPLGPKPMTPTTQMPPRPDTSSGMPVSSASTPNSSNPQLERYYGRGGLQNLGSARKEKTRKDEKEKKEKKSTGIRGIRGFV